MCHFRVLFEKGLSSFKGGDPKYFKMVNVFRLVEGTHRFIEQWITIIDSSLATTESVADWWCESNRIESIVVCYKGCQAIWRLRFR